jgi:hypothetical protein
MKAPKIKMGDIFHEIVLNDASPLILGREGNLENPNPKKH